MATSDPSQQDDARPTSAPSPEHAAGAETNLTASFVPAEPVDEILDPADEARNQKARLEDVEKQADGLYGSRIPQALANDMYYG